MIKNVDTPNPHWVKFVTGKTILKDKNDTLDFPSIKYASISPLAEKIIWNKWSNQSILCLWLPFCDEKGRWKLG